MQLAIFLLLFASALVGTAVALRLAMRVRDRSGVLFAVGLAAGAAVLWLLVTAGAFNVTTISDGQEFAHSYPGLGVVGVLGVGVSALIIARGSIELMD